MTWRLGVCVAALFAWGFCLGHFSNRNSKTLWLLLILATSIFSAFYFVFCFRPVVAGYQYATVLAVVPLGLLLPGLPAKTAWPGKTRIAWAAFICGFALIFCLGSNNQVFVPLSMSSFFLFLGLSIPAVGDGASAPFRMAGLAVSGLLVMMFLTLSAWALPYRQPAPLWSDDTLAQIPAGVGALRLTKSQGGFLNQLREITEGDFEPGTPVIDLTGRLPGVVYAMGGLLPKTPWMSSGYPGSGRAAVFALKRLTCLELAKAWVIMAEEPASFHFDPRVLSAAGLDHQNHYQLAGRAGLPVHDAADSPIVMDLLLLRPVDGWEARAETCQARRDAAAR